MASELRTVGRHTLVYGAGMVATKLVSFLMLPVYTHFLTPTDFGILELLENTVDVIGMIAGMGLAAGVFKYYAEIETQEGKRQLLSTVLIGNSALSLAVTILGVACSGFLNRLIFKGNGNPLYFRIFFVAYFFQSFTNLGLAIVRAEERSGLFVGATLGRLVVTLSLNIWFVVGLRVGIIGVLAGNTIGSALMAITLAVYTFRKTGIQFSFTAFRNLSKFGAPVGISTLGSFVLTSSDRFFLNHYAGSAPVGVYSLAYSFSFLLSAIAVTPFTQIWEPRRFAIAKEPNANDVYRRMFFYLNVGLFITSIGIILFIKDVLTLLVSPAFVPAYQVVPLLLATTIVQQWTWYTNFGLFLKNATRVMGWTGVGAALAALALNWLLIPRYGMFGAAWATILAYILRFIPMYVLSQSKYHVKYPWRKVAGLTAMLVVVLVVRHFANVLSLPASLAVSVAMLAIIGVWLYALIFDADERLIIRELVDRARAFTVRKEPRFG